MPKSFAGTYQGGVSVELLSATGSNPLADWKVTGRPKKVYDKACKGYVFVLEGASTTRLQLPKDERQPLGLQQPFFVLQGLIPQGRAFLLELHVLDQKRRRRRIIVSSSSTQVDVTAMHARLPLGPVLRGQWLNLCFDLRNLVSELWGAGVHYCSTELIAVQPSCRIRRMATMRGSPADTTEDDVALGCERTLWQSTPVSDPPRAWQYPSSVPHVAQVYHMAKVRYYCALRAGPAVVEDAYGAGHRGGGGGGGGGAGLMPLSPASVATGLSSPERSPSGSSQRRLLTATKRGGPSMVTAFGSRTPAPEFSSPSTVGPHGGTADGSYFLGDRRQQHEGNSVPRTAPTWRARQGRDSWESNGARANTAAARALPDRERREGFSPSPERHRTLSSALGHLEQPRRREGEWQASPQPQGRGQGQGQQGQGHDAVSTRKAEIDAQRRKLAALEKSYDQRFGRGSSHGSEGSREQAYSLQESGVAESLPDDNSETSGKASWQRGQELRGKEASAYRASAYSDESAPVHDVERSPPPRESLLLRDALQVPAAVPVAAPVGRTDVLPTGVRRHAGVPGGGCSGGCRRRAAGPERRRRGARPQRGRQLRGGGPATAGR